MALANGMRLGPYEIVAPIGAGGMGEVYRARDTRLGRTVAVKTLPAEFAHDAKLKIRFEQEAKAISALSHPNICALHDVGPDYLVMEYCEGKTLAQRIAQGPLPIEQVIEYGSQIADALDKAHRAGIIHRDLKPSNIIVTKSGAKLLDFGLARRYVNGAPEESTMQRVTEEATLLGTVQYMAPELFSGKDADARSDIFALGLILYEMATGKSAFAGDSRAKLIAAILEHEPPHVEGHAALDRLVRQCIAKDPDERMQNAHDVLLELRSTEAVNGRAETKQRFALPIVLSTAFVAAAAAAGITWTLLRHDHQPVPPHRFEIQPPPGVLVGAADNNTTALAISPDGETVAFRGTRDGGTQAALYVRSLWDLAPHAVFPDIAGPNAFFSPDGKWVGYFAEGALWKAPVEGGEPTRICAAQRVRGATWGDDGTIVFADLPRLMRVSSDGGNPIVLTNPSPGDFHTWPRFVPGSRYVLLTVSHGMLERLRNIAVLSLANGKVRELVPGTAPHYAPGRIIYAHYGTLYSLPFDFDRLAATGRPKKVLDDVAFNPYNGLTNFDVAASGSLIYIPGAARVYDTELVWIDRRGNVTSALDQRKPYGGALLSPDGKRIAVTIAKSLEESDLWTYDAERRSWTRLTSRLDAEFNFNWSPDGQWLIVPSLAARSGGHLFLVAADGSAAPRQLTSSDGRDTYGSISPDGKTLIFERQPLGGTVSEIMTLRLTAGAQPEMFLPTGQHPSFSPDGKWVAYESDETGVREVHVRPFPGREPRVTVSTDGGSAVFWSADGGELFYRRSQEVWRVSVSASGGLFHASRPERLFTSDVLSVHPWGSRLQLSPDGTKFLAVRGAFEHSRERRIVYAPNWLSELK